MKNKAIISVISVLLVMSMLAGCGGAVSSVSAVDSGESSSLPESSSSMPESSSEADPFINDSGASEPASSSSGASSPASSGASSSGSSATVNVKTIAEAKSANSDVVGWLRVPNTTVNEPVVCYTKDVNDYYLRRNWQGGNDYNGCYFSDYRGKFGNRSALSNNTVIYGHSMDDDASGERFSQLKKFKDITFAQNNPYIYFSTSDGEEYAWQVFAVFNTSTTMGYNNPTISGVQTERLAAAAKKISLYNYNVSVSKTDKILTLSTCIYSYGGKTLSYPNEYRFVVMAKLVPASTSLSKTVSLTANSKANK